MRSNRGKRRAHFWPIAGRDEKGGGPGALAVDVLDGGRALAVFGFEEVCPEGPASLLPSETRTGARLG